ncbi:hypothetical protein G3O08_16025 [Cryomorpha ignava]|uniref:Uncharacterized protein n=2 Tax=Cryomorpha ignava TaxID=101383 RepID=A0A7K3WTJ6_9FLAO|nr:hypothetical protein [Cryomorpha ignava]
MILFSLLLDGLLVVAIYSFFAFRYGSKKMHDRTLKIIIGFLPILIFQGTIAVYFATNLDGVQVSSHTLTSIFEHFSLPILIVTLGIIASYLLDAKQLSKLPLSYKSLEQNMIYQALIVSAVGLTAIFALGLAGDANTTIIVTSMAVIRIGLEALLYRKSRVEVN